MAYNLQSSRSQPDSRGVQESVKTEERKAVIEAINRAILDDPPTLEEDQLLQGIRHSLRKLLEAES